MPETAKADCRRGSDPKIASFECDISNDGFERTARGMRSEAGDDGFG
jgi:hypothetical protein